ECARGAAARRARATAMFPRNALPFRHAPSDLRGRYTTSSPRAKRGGRRSALDLVPVASIGGTNELRIVLAVARGDEAALRLERSHVGARQFRGNLVDCGAAGGEAFDQPFIDRLAFAVLLRAEGGGHVQ